MITKRESHVKKQRYGAFTKKATKRFVSTDDIARASKAEKQTQIRKESVTASSSTKDAILRRALKDCKIPMFIPTWAEVEPTLFPEEMDKDDLAVDKEANRLFKVGAIVYLNQDYLFLKKGSKGIVVSVYLHYSVKTQKEFNYVEFLEKDEYGESSFLEVSDDLFTKSLST